MAATPLLALEEGLRWFRMEDSRSVAMVEVSRQE